MVLVLIMFNLITAVYCLVSVLDIVTNLILSFFCDSLAEISISPVIG